MATHTRQSSAIHCCTRIGQFALPAICVLGIMIGAASWGESNRDGKPEDTPNQRMLLGADVYIGELAEMVQYGRQGSIVGLLGDAPVCNAGDAPLDWLTGIGERHPFMNWNLYRYHNGRLMQIGQSWTKHGLGASQDNECNFGCQPYPNGDRLGVGCSDTYSANFNNNTLSFFGPRHEVNPWTGHFPYPGSHISQGNHPHGPIDHRLQVHDDDLDDVQHGAQYFAECYVLAWDDADHLNSIAHEQAIVSGSPGGTWSFNISANGTFIGPAIESWDGATVSIVPANPTNDGRVYVASKITTHPNGSHRYEYAIYNHDMERAVGALTIPASSGIVVGNVGMHSPRAHDGVYSTQPWNFTQPANALKWATTNYSVNQFANSIRWGTMYNFWFDSLSAPASGNLTVQIFKPGTPTQLQVNAQAPTVARKPGDINNDGTVNVSDLLAVIAAWGPCPAPAPNNCTADVAPLITGDGNVNVSDLLLIIGNWG